MPASGDFALADRFHCYHMLPGAKVEQLSDGNETLICSSVCAEDEGKGGQTFDVGASWKN